MAEKKYQAKVSAQCCHSIRPSTALRCTFNLFIWKSAYRFLQPWDTFTWNSVFLRSFNFRVRSQYETHRQTDGQNQ